jgi:hypothetical protein
MKELAGQVKEVERKIERLSETPQPSSWPGDDRVFVEITCDVDGYISYRVESDTHLNVRTTRTKHTMDVSSLIQRARAFQLSLETAPDRWQSEAQVHAQHLDGELRSPRDLNRDFGRAKQTTKNDPSRMVVSFVGARDHLSIGWELLLHGVAEFALCRGVYGISADRAGKFVSYIRNMQALKKRAQVLVAATAPEFEGEAVEVEETIKQGLTHAGLEFDVRRLTHEESASGRLRKLLDAHASPHFLHIAGKLKLPLPSPLAEIAGEHCAIDLGREQGITATQLALYLRRGGESTCICCFFSIDQSAVTGDARNLAAGHTCLGIMDAAVFAGVPIVLGYRWPMERARARYFARSFYTNLFHHMCPARADYEARRTLGTEFPAHHDRLSPVLVVQKP